jgi:hypothetical protein
LDVGDNDHGLIPIHFPHVQVSFPLSDGYQSSSTDFGDAKQHLVDEWCIFVRKTWLALFLVSGFADPPDGLIPVIVVVVVYGTMSPTVAETRPSWIGRRLMKTHPTRLLRPNYS